MSEAIGVLAALVGLTLTGLAVHFLVQLWHDWAEDRRREAEYARQFRDAHWHNQDRGRYLTDDPNRPEN